MHGQNIFTPTMYIKIIQFKIAPRFGLLIKLQTIDPKVKNLSHTSIFE